MVACKKLVSLSIAYLLQDVMFWVSLFTLITFKIEP